VKDLIYKRNWSFEQNVDVFFLDGSSYVFPARTDNKGRIEYVEINDKRYKPDQLGDLGVVNVSFITPAKLIVKPSVETLVSVYKRLGETIGEGDAMEKAKIREQIAKKLHSQGLNLHDLM